MTISTGACARAAVYPVSICLRLSTRLYCIYSHAHIWLHVCVSLCVYKAALDGHWGRRWPDRCVCLGSDSAFHIPLWYSVLWPQETRPAKKLSLAAFLSFSLLPPPHFSLSVSLFPSLPLYHLLRPLFISKLGKSSVIPHPHPHSLLFKSFSSTFPHFFLTEVSWRGTSLSTPSFSRNVAAVTENSQHFTMSRSLNVSFRYIFFLY